MFPRSNVAITGGNFWHTELRFETAFEKLQRASAPSAFHNSSARFDPPKCHPNTRVAVLEYLMGWIIGHNDPEALILWLYGPAGAGKSAILQTMAERCFECKVLLASFFFGRSDSTRNTFKPFVATIAYQIAIAIPEFKPLLENIIERDPLIFDKSIATQLECLVFEPLKELATSGNNLRDCARLLILIDGLDECQDPAMQSMILRALANALRHHKLPLVFLIASRPEQRITLTFNSRTLAGLWRSLVLDDSFEPDDDIRLFLEESFRDIKLTHPHRDLIPEAWPEPSDVNKLIWKSSGQFIYSAVVIKYVSADVDRPPRRLEVVMGLRSARHDVPFAELDALYMHILGSCTDPDMVLSILGLFVTGISPFPDHIEMHLDIEPGDVAIALAPLTSIIHINAHQFIELRHASFSDFLVDITRSGPFYIDTLSIKEHFIPKCISRLMDPYSITGHNLPDWNLLEMLANVFHPSQRNVPLTEIVECALKGFSLPKFWSIWSSGHYNVNNGTKVYFVHRFLEFLSQQSDDLDDMNRNDFHPLPLGFATIYKHHLSSFEYIIQSQVQKYYQDVGLMSLIVISILDTNESLVHLDTLLRLTEELQELDYNRLSLQSTHGRMLLATHYRYLFTGSRKSPGVCLDGNKYAQVALRILEYLCDHPPCPLPYRIHQLPKTHSRRTEAFSVANRPSHPLPSHCIVRRLRPTDSQFLRKGRQEKHQHGLALSIPNITDLQEDSPIRQACSLGLSILPYILERSTRSPELMDFMRRRGKDIAFMPKWTRRAIYAMYEYLNRVDDENPWDIIDLQEKFAAMVIV